MVNSPVITPPCKSRSVKLCRMRLGPAGASLPVPTNRGRAAFLFLRVRFGGNGAAFELTASPSDEKSSPENSSSVCGFIFFPAGGLLFDHTACCDRLTSASRAGRTEGLGTATTPLHFGQRTFLPAAEPGTARRVSQSPQWTRIRSFMNTPD